MKWNSCIHLIDCSFFFRGDADVRVNLVDTSCFHQESHGDGDAHPPSSDSTRYRAVFGRALKSHKGFVLPLEALKAAAANLGGTLMKNWFVPKPEIECQRYCKMTLLLCAEEPLLNYIFSDLFPTWTRNRRLGSKWKKTEPFWKPCKEVASSRKPAKGKT